ncbi:MAG: EI24 domain-containing protein [Actinomycetota bacterium]
MLRALYKAVAQLPDPPVKRVLVRGVMIGIATYVALVAGVRAGLAHVQLFQDAWADWTAGLAIGLAATLLPLLFFPALVTTITSFMLEGVADAVEARHYPGLNWPRPQRWTEVLGTSLRFLLVIAAANLLALPVYLALLLTGLALPLSFAVNGYLLGREYFELVALRRLPPAEARVLFSNRLGRFWLGGVVIAFLFSIPLVNLAAPVIATAFMVHLFQSLQPPARKV